MPPAFSQPEEELNLLRLYYRDKDLVFTPTRNSQPVSRTAENVTIVTAEEIERMNAHTLTDVLNSIPGVQVQIRGGPGIASNVNIQGSEAYHVLTLIDGVKLNSLGENIADTGSIPVQMIERVEILKGPGSSTWGSSLGGVINIITKSPGTAKPFGGVASASYGSHGIGDYRTEITGTSDRLGYYLYGGHLTSNGFEPHTSVYETNTYAKLTWTLPKGKVAWTGGYISNSRGEGRFPEMDQSISMAVENFFSTLSLDYRPIDDLEVDLSVRAIRNRLPIVYDSLSSVWSDFLSYEDYTLGASAKASYIKNIHTFVLGADFDDGEADAKYMGGKRNFQTLAFFANDAMAIGDLTIIPGIRYDDTSTSGSFVSPSLGIAYKMGDTTTLRAYGARGFNVPRLSSMYSTSPGFVPNPDLDVEKVSSLQVGFESFAMRYFWLKATLFRNEISDAINFVSLPGGLYTAVNTDRQRRQGVEVELKTRPFRFFSFTGGVAYIDARDKETDDYLPESPRYTYDIGVEYNNPKLFFAQLKGHYIRFNSVSDHRSKDSSFIWDIHASKTLWKTTETATEIFLSVHNLFDGEQFLLSQWPNPSRWMEVGLRMKF